MDNSFEFGDEKSLQEANIFLKTLEEIGFNKKYKLVSNMPNIYKKKILSAYFVIKFESDFYLKVLRKYNVYDFEFIPSDFENGKMTFAESREYGLNFFDILCDLHDDIYFDLDSFFPKNFESTKTYEEYYEYFDDKKGERHYGIKPNKIVEFINKNYDLISAKFTHSHRSLHGKE